MEQKQLNQIEPPYHVQDTRGGIDRLFKKFIKIVEVSTQKECEFSQGHMFVVKRLHSSPHFTPQT